MGVYKIVHRPTGKVYIGSSANIGTRMAGHRSNLNKQEHPCRELQQLVDRDGMESLEVVVVEEVHDCDALVDRERSVIESTPTDILLNTVYVPKPEAPKPVPMTGSELRSWRKRHSVTMQYLADQLGYERTVIWRWETGDRRVPPWMELALRTIGRDLNEERRHPEG